MTVHVSGPVLSSLLFDQIQSTGSQEGLFLGEVVITQRKAISDSAMSHSVEDLSYVIQESVAFPTPRHFYDRSGNILEERVSRAIKRSAKKIIGWYKVRANTDVNHSSFWETLVHRNLAKMAAAKPARRDASSPPELLFGVFSSSQTESKSTHKLSHLIKVCDKDTGQFRSLPIKITNMERSSSRNYQQKQQGASNLPSTVQRCVDRHMSGLVHSTSAASSAGTQFVMTSEINALADDLQEDVNKEAQSIVEQEVTIGLLREELSSLRNRLLNKRSSPLSDSLPKNGPTLAESRGTSAWGAESCAQPEHGPSALDLIQFSFDETESTKNSTEGAGPTQPTSCVEDSEKPATHPTADPQVTPEVTCENGPDEPMPMDPGVDSVGSHPRADPSGGLHAPLSFSDLAPVALTTVSKVSPGDAMVPPGSAKVSPANTINSEPSATLDVEDNLLMVNSPSYKFRALDEPMPPVAPHKNPVRPVPSATDSATNSAGSPSSSTPREGAGGNGPDVAEGPFSEVVSAEQPISEGERKRSRMEATRDEPFGFVTDMLHNHSQGIKRDTKLISPPSTSPAGAN